MPSTYSSLKIELMATGEQNNSWGDITNTNLGTALEEAITGSADVTFASANVTLTLTDTNTTQSARNLRLNCIGTTGGSSRNLVVPAIEKQYIVNNACGDSIVVKNATGTGVTVPAGTSAIVYNNGTNVVDAFTFMSSLSVSGAISGTTGSFTGDLATTGTLFCTSPNSSTTGAIRLRDATGNPDAVYLQALSNNGGTQYGYLRFRSSGQIDTYGGLNVAGNMVASGRVYGYSPNVSTAGALTLQDASGNPDAVYIQAVNNTGSAEYGNLKFKADGTIGHSGAAIPLVDNALSCGTASFRWSEVYAGTGTINTSDEREKVWRGPATDAEMAAARAIIAELGFYQWKDSVAEKGPDEARYHFGARAQRVWTAMAEQGLVEPIADDKPGKTPYGFLCWDELADGTNRFGLRLDELTLFLFVCMERRLAALGV